MRETRDLEFKESISNTFLKTVSAYANYGTGKIIFGISDQGEAIGIPNPIQACLDIENKINDAIDPVPHYTLDIDETHQTITLEVKEGRNKPYLYKGKAYRRNDSSTIAIDRDELAQLVLVGMGKSYDELTASEQDLTFYALAEKWQEVIKVTHFSKDVLMSLGLLDYRDGYTNAGALLADTNAFPGIDMARFGESISIILGRHTFSHMSILKVYEEAVKIYQLYYQYEVIQGVKREMVEKIPEVAFREAVANALIHRMWNIRGHIQISMFDDHLTITFPGGLPNGVSQEQYMNGQLSILRNPTIGNVFFRLHLIEQLGTGISRILEAFENSRKKPIFEVTESAITISLPVVETSLTGVSEEAIRMYDIIEKGPIASSEIMNLTHYSKARVISLVKELLAAGYIVKVGTGRGTKYRIA